MVMMMREGVKRGEGGNADLGCGEDACTHGKGWDGLDWKGSLARMYEWMERGDGGLSFEMRLKTDAANARLWYLELLMM